MVECPNCEGDYTRIGQHWSNSSSCDYPYPSEYERAILTGVWLAGATVSTSGKIPQLVKYSKYKTALEWIGEEVGIWHSSLTEEPERDTLSEFVGKEGAHTNTTWRWISVSCPWLDHLEDAALTDDRVSFDPVTARILTSFRGSVNDGTLSLWYRNGPELTQVLEDEGFEVNLTEYEDRSDVIWFVEESDQDYLSWIDGPIPPLSGKF